MRKLGEPAGDLTVQTHQTIKDHNMANLKKKFLKGCFSHIDAVPKKNNFPTPVLEIFVIFDTYIYLA